MTYEHRETRRRSRVEERDEAGRLIEEDGFVTVVPRLSDKVGTKARSDTYEGFDAPSPA